MVTLLFPLFVCVVLFTRYALLDRFAPALFMGQRQLFIPRRLSIVFRTRTIKFKGILFQGDNFVQFMGDTFALEDVKM